MEPIALPVRYTKPTLANRTDRPNAPTHAARHKMHARLSSRAPPIPSASRNVHALIATGVNVDEHREILGLDVTSSEDGAGWLAFLRGLAARDRRRTGAVQGLAALYP